LMSSRFHEKETRACPEACPKVVRCSGALFVGT
jgi:hypothetical protein